MLRLSLVSLAVAVPLFVSAPAFAQEGGEGEGEGEGEGDVGEGEGEGEGDAGEGEGEGEGGDADAEVVAFCATVVECTAEDPPTQEECEGIVGADIDAAQGVGDPTCDDAAAALLAQLNCLSALDCTTFNDETDTTSCAAESDAVNALVDAGAGPCFDGEAPIEVPAEWNCEPSFFGTGDGCDCGCGAADPDCEGAGTVEPGTGVGNPACGFCYGADGQPLGGAFEGSCEGGAAEGEGEPAEGEGEAAEGEGEGSEGEGEGEGEGGGDGGLCSSTTATLSPAFAALGLALVALRRRRR